MSRTQRSLIAVALVALIGLIAAGCGSSASSQAGGSGTSAAGSADTAAPKDAGDQDKAVKFAECIRAHGVPHFPDPDAKGDFDFGVDVSREVWTNAVEACKDLQPPGTLSSKRSPEQQSSALRFAQCMRDNGVEDFPDPANGDPLIDTTRIPSANRPGGMAIINAAKDKCRAGLDEAVGGQG